MPQAYPGEDSVLVASECLEYLLCVVTVVWFAEDSVLKAGNRVAAKDYARGIPPRHIFCFLNRLSLHKILRRFTLLVLIFSEITRFLHNYAVASLKQQCLSSWRRACED